MSQLTDRYSRYFTYIKPVTQLKIIKNYGSTVFTLFTITIFIFFAIKPTIETILVLQKKIADANTVYAGVTKKADDLTKAKENYQNISNDIVTKINAGLPDSADLKSIILGLEGLANVHQATVSALQIQPLVLESKQPDTIGAVAEIDFTFNVAGSYTNLTGLLQDINHSSRVISIDHVSINKGSQGADLIMSMNGKAYYLK